MSWIERIAWNIYILILGFFLWEQALLFFNPNSSVHLYYEMLFYFDPLYFISYFLNFLQVISNFIFIFVIIAFAYNKTVSHKIVWQVFFLIKIVLDITGQNYDANHVISFFHIKEYLGWMALLLYNAIYLPGYLALGIYAFSKPKKINEL